MWHKVTSGLPPSLTLLKYLFPSDRQPPCCGPGRVRVLLSQWRWAGGGERRTLGDVLLPVEMDCDLSVSEVFPPHGAEEGDIWPEPAGLRLLRCQAAVRGWQSLPGQVRVTLTRLGRQLVSTYIHPYYWLWPSWLLTLTLISNAGNCLITLLTLFQSPQPPRESVDEVSVKISDSGQGQQSQQSLRHPHLSPHTDRHHLQLLAEKLLFLQSKLFLKAERKNCIVYYHINYIYDYHYMYMY